jgi:hypothetical protein
MNLEFTPEHQILSADLDGSFGIHVLVFRDAAGRRAFVRDNAETLPQPAQVISDREPARRGTNFSCASDAACLLTIVE